MKQNLRNTDNSCFLNKLQVLPHFSTCNLGFESVERQDVFFPNYSCFFIFSNVSVDNVSNHTEFQVHMNLS